MQLFLRGLHGSTRALHGLSPDTTVLELKALVQEREGIPPALQGLVFQGRQLQDEQPLCGYAGLRNDSTLHLVLRLRGGKGGFGNLLRGQGRDGKVTTNFDAMRDLSGRRLRNQTIEKKLEAWKAAAPERELEKVALQHIKELARQQRREAAEEVDVHAIAEAHEAVAERTRQATLEAIGQGLAGAAKASTSSEPSTSKAAATQGEGAPGASALGKRARQDGASTSAAAAAAAPCKLGGACAGAGKQQQAAPAPKKSKCMLDMLEDLGSDYSSDDSDE